ncbi:MAG: Acylneuraminate cytidylyltransferase [Parcubacteria group bacterium GW2011_GWA2_38_13]|nr:MAG: Acylneuraminate cytidylyltransferase [Parcubacteria group bacterium GW2011_GWA2_38_13]
MFNDKKILAIIPARGGSKRLPRKNIRPLAGKPLLAYSIEAARSSQYIDRIIVSTEDMEIANIAKKFGADVPALRPMELAEDATKSDDVLKYTAEYMESKENYIPDIIVLIQPTSPLVSAEDIDKTVETLIAGNSHSSLTVCEITERPEWMYRLNGNVASPYIQGEVPYRHQDMQKLYRTNGAVYCVKREILLKKGILVDKESLRVYIMPKERSVDIDDINDFNYAETLIENNKNTQ